MSTSRTTTATQNRESSEMCCPNCGEKSIHQGMVEVLTGNDAIRVSGERVTRQAITCPTGLNCVNARFWCEACAHSWSQTSTFDHGRTFVSLSTPVFQPAGIPLLSE